MSQRGIIKNSLTADIAAEHHAALFKSLYGASGILSVFDNLACTRIDDNTVSLAPGVYNLSGFGVMVDPGTTEELTIDSGTSGQDRNDLVVAEFVRNGDGAGVDTLHFTVVKGTSAPTGTAVDPTLTQQDINGAGVTRQEALYRVSIIGTTLTTITKIASTVSSINLVQYESGSNADGNWLKFADGTMICNSKVSQSSASTIALESGGFRTAGVNFNYPQSFVGDEPFMSVSANTSRIRPMVYPNSSTPLQSGVVMGHTVSSYSTEMDLIYYITMIGKWK
jgi:hypothetical protein